MAITKITTIIQTTKIKEILLEIAIITIRITEIKIIKIKTINKEEKDKIGVRINRKTILFNKKRAIEKLKEKRV